MRFFYLKEEYIQFLRQHDDKVAFNKNETRPYMGVVLNIDGVKYYAPLSSPKPKHRQMKNGKDFRKICGGKYGAINFNNMIPVPDEALISFDIQDEKNSKYQKLLFEQHKEIKKDEKGILKTAKGLRALLFADEEKLSPYEKTVKERCCNLPRLEEAYKSYSPKKEQTCGEYFSEFDALPKPKYIESIPTPTPNNRGRGK